MSIDSLWATLRRYKLVGLLLLDLVLLVTFPPSRWPMLWSQLAVPLLLVGAVLLIWLQQRQRWTKVTQLRLAGGGVIFLSQAYAIHSIEIAVARPTLVAILHASAVTWIACALVLSIWNQRHPRDQREAPPLPDTLPAVAAVIPTYGEPVDVLEPAVRSLCALDYPRDLLTVYISDDGHRPEVAALAERYGVIYQSGPRKDAKAGNLNSVLALIHRIQPNCDLVITQDADEVIAPTFVHRVLGYFSDPLVALVQTPKECVVPTDDPFGNRDRIFYDSVQPGRNGDNAAFACGSGVIWRISAVESVGGFNTWNLVEDMTTSYELHSAGYRSEYHNEVLSVGLAPDDIPGLIKQRGTWAVDTWRMFLFNNPLLKRGKLTLAQRLQYLELGLFYCTSAFIFPLLGLVPILSLLSGDFLTVEGVILFPWLIGTMIYHIIMADGSLTYAWRYWQYWLSHSPTYVRAFWTAVQSRTHKPRYVVTRKTRLGGFHGQLLWAQFSMIMLAGVSIFVGVVQFGATHPIYVLTNALIIMYYTLLLNGICSASFYGISLHDLPIMQHVIRSVPTTSPRVPAESHSSSMQSVVQSPELLLTRDVGQALQFGGEQMRGMSEDHIQRGGQRAVARGDS